jgi:hypothetical protein
MPIDASWEPINGSAAAGFTTSLGTIRFYYEPNMVGEWSVECSYPGEDMAGLHHPDEIVTYLPSSSEPFSFTVQQEPVVEAGLLTGWPWQPLPENYWERPVNTDNREWYQISGDWLMRGYDDL